ncbi:DUF6338 family protein [Halopiger djelfimassiliensis]|uniref:DUF6338 family protein n=1 Tax=Halopiger djelfimassiliensis TaxID=1293047 RepID=UPI0006776897|nr:DUF6338 family protein [Halopiger djelfimassiliensis]
MPFNSLSIGALAAFVAPGFVSVMLAISIGVVERNPSRFKILIASLISSLVTNAIFIWLYQVLYGPITELSQLENVFFDPEFQPQLVLIYAVITLLLGAVYSLELIYETRGWLRDRFWSRQDVQRHRRQPWEGAMDNAKRVRVKTPSNARIIGRVVEYSRIEKPRQLWLDDVYWVDEETEQPFQDGVTDSIVLFEDDIERIAVIETE